MDPNLDRKLYISNIQHRRTAKLDSGAGHGHKLCPVSACGTHTPMKEYPIGTWGLMYLHEWTQILTESSILLIYSKVARPNCRGTPITHTNSVLSEPAVPKRP